MGGGVLKIDGDEPTASLQNPNAFSKGAALAGQPSTGPKRVLVVDDDPDILDALSEILEAEGFAVMRARNGQEALERVDAQLPSLILLDLMMPVMDGWEFARRLRQQPGQHSSVPIIVLSADRNVGAKAQEIGAVGHLAKPFELSDLLDLVEKNLPESSD